MEPENIGALQEISIHTPHAGSDLKIGGLLPINFVFQSTLPMRGATCLQVSNTYSIGFQSTLPMRGATQCLVH